MIIILNFSFIQIFYFLLLIDDCENSLFICFQNVFPGLWLVGITADAYRVADTPTKVLFFYLRSTDTDTTLQIRH